MSIRQFRPMTAGTRFRSVSGFDEITRDAPEKSLLEPLKKSGGRNNRGELTSWWRGGGHKRLYRVIDFKRDKKDIPARVETIEYDPNRSSRIALIEYADGVKRYIIAPVGLKPGRTIESSGTGSSRKVRVTWDGDWHLAPERIDIRLPGMQRTCASLNEETATLQLAGNA